MQKCARCGRQIDSDEEVTIVNGRIRHIICQKCSNHINNLMDKPEHKDGESLLK